MEGMRDTCTVSLSQQPYGAIIHVPVLQKMRLSSTEAESLTTGHKLSSGGARCFT